MTNYFKTKDDALSNAIMAMMESRGEAIWSFSKAQCDCGESQAVIVDDLESNKQVCNNIICETCHEQYG
jgi:DNA-binding transcriptional regulator YbjK